MRREVIVLGATVAICAFALDLPVFSGQVTTNFDVTATVLDDCSVTATDLAFGNYSASTGAPVDATSTIQVTCTPGSAYTVLLDGGTTAADVTARAMTDGTHNLLYGLYTTSGRTTVWGDGTGGTATQSGSGNGSAQSLTVYGRIPAGQFVAGGSYRDTIGVTVNF